jgi:hypothetical protein
MLSGNPNTEQPANTLPPDNVADNLMSLSRFLIHIRRCSRVVVYELLRLEVNRHFEITLAEFQSHVVNTSNMLQAKCKKSQFPIVWRKLSLMIQATKSIMADGTHQNELGMWNENISLKVSISLFGSTAACFRENLRKIYGRKDLLVAYIGLQQPF